MGWIEAVPGVPGAEIHEVAYLPDTLEGAISVGLNSVARPGTLLRDMPGIGRFLARDGALIQVCLDPGADRVEADQYIHGAVRSVLVHQRGGSLCMDPA